MKEIWKVIDGFGGKYQISNLGRIKSFGQSKEGKIKTGYVDKKGYVTIRLYHAPCQSRFYKIHRLVASVFVPNPHNLPQVNHKDENKENNCVDNLEWCTNEYNFHYGTRTQRARLSNMCCKSTSKPVCSVDEEGNTEYFESIGEAERKTGIPHSNIVRALKGRRKTAGRRKWYYK